MYEHVGNPLSSEASECTRLRFYTWARPVVCQQRKSGHRGLQPRRAYLQVQGQRPARIFPEAGCVAKRLNPATGRDRAAGQSPVGLTFRYKAARPMPPTMRRTCAEHAHTFYAGPSLIRGEGFTDWFKRFPRIFVASPRSVQKRVFLGSASYRTTPPALPASFRMMPMMLCMLAMRNKGKQA